MFTKTGWGGGKLVIILLEYAKIDPNMRECACAIHIFLIRRTLTSTEVFRLVVQFELRMRMELKRDRTSY